MQLFFEEAMAAHRRGRVDRIADVNAAFAGGKHANQLMHDLET